MNKSPTQEERAASATGFGETAVHGQLTGPRGTGEGKQRLCQARPPSPSLALGMLG